MTTILDIRRNYLGATGCSDEDLEIVKLIRDYVDKEIMPRRRNLDGGWHHDEKLAMDTINQVHHRIPEDVLAGGSRRLTG